MKRGLLLYIVCPLIVALCAFLCEMDADNGWSSNLNASVLYLLRGLAVLISLTAIVASFTIWKERGRWITISLNVAALHIVLDYYLNLGNAGSDNLLWLLPMLALTYVIKYRVAIKG